MNKLQAKHQIVGEEVYEEVIIKKHETNISTKQIIDDLNLDESVVIEYLNGTAKQNLPLGIMILDYLDNKQQNENVEKE